MSKPADLNAERRDSEETKVEAMTPSPTASKEVSPPPKPTPVYSEISAGRRRFILIVITIAGFFGPLAGNIYLPALPVLQRDFNTSAGVINVTVTVFMLVFAFGPLFWSSFADWKGRRPLYIISLVIYIVANILLAALPANLGALFFLRIVQAFGSAAVVSMGAGTVADTTEPKYRARAMSYFLLGPQCGPVLGPVLGGAFAGNASWRWIFGFLAITGFVLWAMILFMLPETLRARVGNGRIYQGKSWILMPPSLFSELAPEEERGDPPPKPTLKGYWKMFKYPPIGIVCINKAILYSAYFSLAVLFPTALEQVYHWSTSEVGAGYLVPGIAMVSGSLSGGRVSDYRRARAVKALGEEKVHPERRLTDQIWGVFLCSAGLIMFGWFVHGEVHVVAPLISSFLIGFGMSWVFVTSNSFLTECIAQQAAGAFALGNMLRNPAAAIAAAIIEPLLRKMGWGWVFTGLGLLVLVYVGTALLILHIRSPYWRKKRAERMAAMKEKQVIWSSPGSKATPGSSAAAEKQDGATSGEKSEATDQKASQVQDTAGSSSETVTTDRFCLHHHEATISRSALADNVAHGVGSYGGDIEMQGRVDVD